jgi:hypothetical protein
MNLVRAQCLGKEILNFWGWNLDPSKVVGPSSLFVSNPFLLLSLFLELWLINWLSSTYCLYFVNPCETDNQPRSIYSFPPLTIIFKNQTSWRDEKY